MKKELKKLISQGKTKQVIQKLLAATANDDDLHTEVIMQSARFEKFSKENRMGTATQEQTNISHAKINDALLDITSRLEDKSIPAATKPSVSSSTIKEPTDKPQEGNLWRNLTRIGIVVAIFAGLFRISGCSLNDMFGEGNPDSFSVTVLVHGKDGKDDLILQNQGEVRLDIGTDSRTEAIDKDGEATFKELPIGYNGKSTLISIKHDQPYFPTQRNKEYKLEKGKAIYLEVELKGIDKVKGRITDEATGEPLDSVRVSIEDIAVFTDEFGWYELSIPAEKQAKTVSVTFMKTGYQTENVANYAPHTKQELTFPLKKSTK